MRLKLQGKEGTILNHKERMLAGLPYQAWLDGLTEERLETKKKIFAYNHCEPGSEARMEKLLREILGKMGEGVHIEAPFYCDYGYNIEIGSNFFANHNFIVLDVGKVVIGDNVQIAPNVGLYTAGHPIHPDLRRAGYEYGMGIAIGNDVWIGGNAVVNPGVHIGNNSVIGSGSVVTKDIPDDVVAFGNPCRVVRKITDEDRRYYYKNREFPPEYRD